MGPLASLERLLERLLERTTARLFGTRLRPIHLQRRIERAMERERRSGADRVRVPEHYRLHLAPADLVALGGPPDEVATGLADAALVFARSRGYWLAERPRVELVADSRIARGDIRVATGFDREDAGPTSGEDVSDRTMVFERPVVRSPSATIREVRRDGLEREIALDGNLLTIGRADDNGLVLDDARVSRHHARLRARHGVLVLTDLGSRNGVRVNGQTVVEVALGAGDRIEIGDTVLIVDTVAAG
jgi:Protein of unknown function (DUF3662)/Inner membrane component of T3SS, cytoplasmic domain